MNKVLLHQFDNKDTVYRSGKGIIMQFSDSRRVLSSSMLNGGLQDHLHYVFNYNCLADDYNCALHYDTYEQELTANATSLGLDATCASGLSTAAFMENAAICTKSYEDLSVTAIVTAGIDYNAVRVGDPASYLEKCGQYTPIPKGTINIILSVNHGMNAGAMVRAVTVCTEAKSAAINELMIGSNYSTGIATGSGTDGIIIVADMQSDGILTDAGTHSKLGELIGISVKEAVKESLKLQTAACPARSHSIWERGKRYHITLGSFWIEYCNMFSDHTFLPIVYLDQVPITHLKMSITDFEARIHAYHQNSNTVVFTSLFLHLLDQYQYQLLEWPEVLRECRSLCEWYLKINHLEGTEIYPLDYCTKDPIGDLIHLYNYSVILRSLFGQQ